MQLGNYATNHKHEENKDNLQNKHESIHTIGRINYKTSSRFMVWGTTKGLASHNIRNPNAIHNKRQDWNHNEKLPQTSRRKHEDEVLCELQPKWLQASRWHSLIQLFFTSSWNPSNSPEISAKGSSQNLIFGFYFAVNELVHGHASGCVWPMFFLAAIRLNSKRKMESIGLHGREHDRAW